MQTAGSGPDSPSTAIFATLPVTASGHPGNLGYNHLEEGIDVRRRKMEASPRLDLGLDPAQLVAKVPSAMIKEIVSLLKPVLVVPGGKVVRRGEAGDAMYFISSGAVEVGIEPDPITIGSGDFFGELAF